MRQFTNEQIAFTLNSQQFRQWYTDNVDTNVDWNALQDDIDNATDCKAISTLRPHWTTYYHKVWRPAAIREAAHDLYALLATEEAARQLQREMQADGLTEAEQLQHFISAIVDARHNP